MHFRLEIVMPPVDDIEAAITSIMAPFVEYDEHLYAARRAKEK